LELKIKDRTVFNRCCGEEGHMGGRRVNGGEKGEGIHFL
jgi:hypothetical protein